jgi:hypothetical protein
MNDDKTVTVTIAGNSISVSPDPVKPKKNQDKVKWECATGPFTIDLPSESIEGKQNGSTYVGMSKTFPTVEKIKYSVSAPGAETLDPEVDVQP